MVAPGTVLWHKEVALHLTRGIVHDMVIMSKEQHEVWLKAIEALLRREAVGEVISTTELELLVSEVEAYEAVHYPLPRA